MIKMEVKTSVFILLILNGLWYSSAEEGKNAGCEIEIMDKCGADMMLLGGEDLAFLESRDKWNKFCEHARNSSVCMTSYTLRCLDTFTRHMLKLLSDSGNTVLEERCTDKGFQDAKSHTPCFKKIAHKLHGCMINIIEELEGIAGANITVKNFLPMVCCAYARYSHCFDQAVQECPDILSRGFMNELKEGYEENTNGLFCSSYTHETPECLELDVPKRDETKPLSLSMFPALLKIFHIFSS